MTEDLEEKDIDNMTQEELDELQNQIDQELQAEVQEEMKQNPRLELPCDPQTEIYKFYEVIEITPVVVEDVLSMLLTIPLIDKSLQMNVYKVHNLPALQTKLGVAAEYIL